MTLKVLGIVATVVIVPLLLAEFTECGRWLAERLVRWAARRLRDPEEVTRYEEEWCGNLRHVPGKLTPLFYAIVFVLTVPRMREALGTDRRSRRLAARLVAVLDPVLRMTPSVRKLTEELTGRVRELEMLNTLGTELLVARRRQQVEIIGNDALRTALESAEVWVSLDGEVGSGLHIVRIPGGGGAVIGVPADIAERSIEVVEAAAGLLGMGLQRLELEEELASKIIEEGTRERNRIALEIHDELLPYLAAAEIQADNVRSATAGRDLARAQKLAAATREAVKGATDRMRHTLDSLCPPRP